MSIERLADRAAVHAALGEPIRLAVAEALAESDRTPASLATQLVVGSNLLAHHLNVLDAAGVLVRRPSEADGRRVYLQLTEVGRRAVAGSVVAGSKVLFVCTHNSARSQFAEALWRERSDVPVSSAGTQPADRVHPKAVRVAGRRGIPLVDAKPVEYEDALAAGALVVTVCDQADEQLREPHLHWSVPDPARVDRIKDFNAAFDQIAERVDRLAEVVTP